MTPEALNISKVEMSPDKPGIYAWYARLEINKFDWRKDLKPDGTDDGCRRTSEVLKDFSQYFEKQRINIQATTHFNTKWQGKLEENLADRMSKFDEKLNGVLADFEKRKLAIDMLNSFVPVFAHPLYIGVAESLRVRLKQHADEYYKLRDAQLKGDIDADSYQGDENFAQRAFVLKIKEDNLYVFYQEVNSLLNLQNDEIKETVVLVEWLLNRWATPLLGRR